MGKVGIEFSDGMTFEDDNDGIIGLSSIIDLLLYTTVVKRTKDTELGGMTIWEKPKGLQR